MTVRATILYNNSDIHDVDVADERLEVTPCARHDLPCHKVTWLLLMTPINVPYVVM